MNSIRIKNLRSLVDTGKIDLKPLTILVGKNSSGKSTFLRFFPLMKQTLMTRRREPILWYEKDFVDFGSFEESISRNACSENICMEFEMNINLEQFLSDTDTEVSGNILIEISEHNFEKIKVTLKNICVEIEYLKTEEDVKSFSLKVNGEKEPAILTSNMSEYTNIIPSFRFLNEDGKKEENKIPFRLKDFEDFYQEKLRRNYKWRFGSSFTSFEENFLITHLKNVFYGEIDEVIEDLELSYDFEINNISEDEDYSSINKNEDNEDEEENFFIFLKNCDEDEKNKIFVDLVMSNWDHILSRINSLISNKFENVKYIAPLRASAQRYYRLQGLSVDEIDSQGENIPMMLKHMGASESYQFKKWVYENFNFEISTEYTNGHVNLLISFDKENKLNLADTGFGYSQILPIIVMLWKITQEAKKFGSYANAPSFFRKNRNSSFYVAIEQPELHLHPAMQAQLTNVFAKCIALAKTNNFDLKIIIETHSETIINRIGNLVYKDKIFSDDVNLLMFGDTDKNHINTKIESVKYNSEGIIDGWPMGFFYPED